MTLAGHSYIYVLSGKDGKVVLTDAYGKRLHGKPQLLVRRGKVCAADAYGKKRQKLAIESK